MISQKGLGNVTIDTLVQEITPKARSELKFAISQLTTILTGQMSPPPLTAQNIVSSSWLLHCGCCPQDISGWSLQDLSTSPLYYFLLGLWLRILSRQMPVI